MSRSATCLAQSGRVMDYDARREALESCTECCVRGREMGVEWASRI